MDMGWGSRVSSQKPRGAFWGVILSEEGSREGDPRKRPQFLGDRSPRYLGHPHSRDSPSLLTWTEILPRAKCPPDVY